MKQMFKTIFLFFLTVSSVAQTVQMNIPSPNDRVNTIVRYNNTIYVGGEFDSVGNTARNFLAAIDANTGAVLSWNPNPSHRVTKLLIAGNKLVVAGTFNNISGTALSGIAIYDLATNSLLPSATGSTSGTAEGIAQKDNFIYYLTPDSLFMLLLKRFDINTLQLDPNWVGDTDLGSGTFNSMTTLGNYVYLGGLFSLNPPTSTTIRKLCRFNIADGTLDTSFYFNFLSPDYMREVLGHSNGMLYVTGNFTQIDGLNRNGIVEIDPSGSGSVTTKNIYCSNHYNWGLAEQGNTIWIGGNSVAIGGINRYTIAQVDLHTGIATCWFTQALSGNVYHYSIFATHDTVYVAPSSEGFKALTGNPGYVNMGNDTIICPGGSITLSAPSGLSGYYWSNGATTQSITVNTPGNYWVSASDPGGCLVSGTRVIDACTSVPSSPQNIDLLITPTISSGQFQLTFTRPLSNGVLSVRDMSGREVMTQHIPDKAEHFTIDISVHPQGVYLVQYIQNGIASKPVSVIKQ